jgi:hypothetical protein
MPDVTLKTVISAISVPVANNATFAYGKQERQLVVKSATDNVVYNVAMGS